VWRTIFDPMNQNLITIDIPFETLLEAAQRLSTPQKRLLAQRLQAPNLSVGPTRGELIAELQTSQAAGLFFQTESLRNKFAQEANDELNDEQLLADIRTAATKWEEELDEFYSSTG
jgi:hypothetical protein